MMRSLVSLILAAFGVVAALPAAAFTQTNVLQNVALQFTVYKQGATNANGKSVAVTATPYTTKTLLASLAAATTNNFGANAKLVIATPYVSSIITNVQPTYSNVLSTNLGVPTNDPVLIIAGVVQGGTNGFFINGNQLTVAGNPTIISGTTIVPQFNTNESITFSTNSNAVTTVTPQFDTNNLITNYTILEQVQLTPGQTKTVFTNLSPFVAVLYGTASSPTLFPVSNYVSIATVSAVISAQTGTDLNTPGAGTVASQNDVSIQTLGINPTTSNYPYFEAQGFVKDSLKVDVLGGKGATKVTADVVGASASWSANGYGYFGVPQGVSPPSSQVVVQGTVTVSFLQNLVQ